MARPTTAILVASDGSASEQENTMSFGWVISLLDLMTLATHSGPAFEHASSFCAEDNKGVITRATNQIEYEYDYLYNTLEPNWDIIAQLAEYLQTLGPKLKIAHVQSHQDNNCDFDQLDIPAQLNVQADELAMSYRENFSQPQATIPQLPINDAQLIYDSGTITGRYFKKSVISPQRKI
eukprot:4094032-Ditylum_brightwellii.AAC.1